MLQLPRLSHGAHDQGRASWRARASMIGAAILRAALSAVGLGLLVLISAGSLNPDPFGPRAALRLGAPDSGRTIEIPAGKAFDIVLDGYTANGRGWNRVEADYDVVSIPHPSYMRDWAGGGRTWFSVTADNPGRTRIVIFHDDALESPPVPPFVIDVVVQ